MKATNFVKYVSGIPVNYKSLGWQPNNSEPNILRCLKLGHRERWRMIDRSYYPHRGTDVITICDECKFYWHTDSSD